MVPPEYQNHLRVFSEEAAGRMPESRPYDHAIELVPGARTFHSKLYPLSPNEQVELDKFLKENLAKSYIRESKSPIKLNVGSGQAMSRPVLNLHLTCEYVTYRFRYSYHESAVDLSQGSEKHQTHCRYL